MYKRSRTGYARIVARGPPKHKQNQKSPRRANARRGTPCAPVTELSDVAGFAPADGFAVVRVRVPPGASRERPLTGAAVAQD